MRTEGASRTVLYMLELWYCQTQFPPIKCLQNCYRKVPTQIDVLLAISVRLCFQIWFWFFLLGGFTTIFFLSFFGGKNTLKWGFWGSFAVISFVEYTKTLLCVYVLDRAGLQLLKYTKYVGFLMSQTRDMTGWNLLRGPPQKHLCQCASTSLHPSFYMSLFLFRLI